MTFGEIFKKVCMYLYDGVVPGNFQAELIYDLIETTHRDIQKEYNYWFMYYTGEIASVEGAQNYLLPANFKEIISALWQTVDPEEIPNGFSPLLSFVSSKEAHDALWQDDSSEYPHYAEITGTNIVLYPAPSEIRTLFVNYWGFSSREDDFDSFTDALTEHGGNAIVYRVCADMAPLMLFKTEADVMRSKMIMSSMAEKAYREIETLKGEDRRRRQSHLYKVKYQEF